MRGQWQLTWQRRKLIPWCPPGETPVRHIIPCLRKGLEAGVIVSGKAMVGLNRSTSGVSVRSHETLIPWPHPIDKWLPWKETGNTHTLWIQLFFFLILFILFLAALGLCCCARAFSSWQWVGATLRCGALALGAWASVVMAHGLSSCGLWALERRLSSCGTQA